jgi:hypothetical protein
VRRDGHGGEDDRVAEPDLSAPRSLFGEPARLQREWAASQLSVDTMNGHTLFLFRMPQ